MPLTPLADALQTGTPIAILVTIVGLIWQYSYRLNRDRLQDSQKERESALAREQFNHQKNLEDQQFKHQTNLEEQRFEYEKLRWREELGRGLMTKLLEERVAVYTQLWSYLEVASTSKNKDRTTETTRKVAQEIKKWRYNKGGLLAEDITRDAVLKFQEALWEYDGSEQSRQRMRNARKLVLRSLQADLGLGKNASGKSIFQLIDERQEIGKELAKAFPTTDERDS